MINNKKPNIILIMADQQQARLRKGAGYCFDTMPNLDKLAAKGTDIVNAISPNPICAPARSALFTGRYSSANKVRTNHNLRDAFYEKDLLDVLKENGYRTALCGKNHMYRKPSEDFDFDAETNHLGNEPGRDCEPDSEEMRAYRRFLRGTKFTDWQEPCPFGVEYSLPYRNVSSALRFIDSSADSPFFIWLSFAEPHNPYQVPYPYYDMFRPDELPALESETIDLAEKGHRFVWLKNQWDIILGDDKARIARMRSNYLGMLRLIDDQLGRLFNGLSERGIYDDTLIIYVSDHGDFAGEYGMMRKGADLADILARVPMIWKIPGFKGRGRVEEGYANLIDVFPTVCDYLGVDIPFGVQGKSILPMLKSDEEYEKYKEEFDSAISESGFGGLYFNDDDELTPVEEGSVGPNYDTLDCLNTWTQCGYVRSVWYEGYRLQLDMDGHGYMYDVKNDYAELKNLYNDPDFANVKLKMLEKLAIKEMELSDPIPLPHFRYRYKRHPKNYSHQKFIWKKESNTQ